MTIEASAAVAAFGLAFTAAAFAVRIGVAVGDLRRRVEGLEITRHMPPCESLVEIRERVIVAEQGTLQAKSELQAMLREMRADMRTMLAEFRTELMQEVRDLVASMNHGGV